MLYTRHGFSALCLGLCVLPWLDGSLAAPHTSLPTTIPSQDARRVQPRQESPKLLFRGDPRSPDEIRQLAGIPTEFPGGPTTNESYSLQVHHLGEGKVASAYTSTTRAFAPALAFAVGEVLNGINTDGWVYMIQPTPNMIDMGQSQFKLTWAAEEEFSAMGGVKWEQISAWLPLPKTILDGHRDTYRDAWWDFQGFAQDFPDMRWVDNKDYSPAYDDASASGGQPQLAGDAANLEKFKEKTLEQWAVEFMNDNGKLVGWKGAFPVDPRSPIGKA